MTRPFNGPLGGVAEQRREPGTFRESLRLTDRRARAGDWQENRPIFTGWSGYPTQLVLCDRDGMTVRAADHRYTTSVRAGGLTLLPSARRPGGQRCGDPVPRAQVAEEVFGKPAAASSTFRMDNRKGGSPMMSPLSSVVKRFPPLCAAWGRSRRLRPGHAEVYPGRSR